MLLFIYYIYLSIYLYIFTSSLNAAKEALVAFRVELSTLDVQINEETAKSSSTLQFIYVLLEQFDALIESPSTFQTQMIPVVPLLPSCSSATAHFLAKSFVQLVCTKVPLSYSLEETALEVLRPWFDQKRELIASVGETYAALSNLVSFAECSRSVKQTDDIYATLSTASTAVTQLFNFSQNFPLMAPLRLALASIVPQLNTLMQQECSPQDLQTHLLDVQHNLKSVLQMFESCLAPPSVSVVQHLLSLIPVSQFSDFVLSQVSQLEVDLPDGAEKQFEVLSDRFCEFVTTRIPAWVICASLKLPREDQVAFLFL